jgi:hypothetical protein
LSSMRPSSPALKMKPYSCRRGSIGDACCREEIWVSRYSFIYPPAGDGREVSSAGSVYRPSAMVER